MKLVQQLTSDTLQEATILLDDGSSFIIELYYIPMQMGWFINRLQYQNFILNGFRICNSPNMLHQFKNIIPFGLACVSIDDREPMLQEDFLSGASQLFVLNEEETDEYERILKDEI